MGPKRFCFVGNLLLENFDGCKTSSCQLFVLLQNCSPNTPHIPENHSVHNEIGMLLLSSDENCLFVYHIFMELLYYSVSFF